jgi:hypothetical protein
MYSEGLEKRRVVRRAVIGVAAWWRRSVFAARVTFVVFFVPDRDVSLWTLSTQHYTFANISNHTLHSMNGYESAWAHGI